MRQKKENKKNFEEGWYVQGEENDSRKKTENEFPKGRKRTSQI